MPETLLSTKEVAKFLRINEKMVYNLIADKGLPATKVTGKWLFPQRLVEEWIQKETLNYHKEPSTTSGYQDLLIVAGSNDILLDRTLSLFNSTQQDRIAVFGNLGSLGGIRMLRRGLCHVASSHLLEQKGEEYNFGVMKEEFRELPAVVSFCRRKQGIVVAKGNPKGINSVADLAKPDVCIANRPVGTGTRLLLDSELNKAGISPDRITGYDTLLHRHLDIGLEVLAGRADAGPAIAAVANLLGLDFIPLRWERFDLLISKERFFDRGVQLFLSLLHETHFRDIATSLGGYDMSSTGKMVYAQESGT
jgi:putative molybdopterin biosynthesis protein